MKLLGYSFIASWQSGKQHCIPDALSRAPVDKPTPDDEDAEADVSHQLHSLVIRSMTQLDEDGYRVSPIEDATLSRVRNAAREDA